MAAQGMRCTAIFVQLLSLTQLLIQRIYKARRTSSAASGHSVTGNLQKEIHGKIQSEIRCAKWWFQSQMKDAQQYQHHQNYHHHYQECQ